MRLTAALILCLGLGLTSPVRSTPASVRVWQRGGPSGRGTYTIKLDPSWAELHLHLKTTGRSLLRAQGKSASQELVLSRLDKTLKGASCEVSVSCSAPFELVADAVPLQARELVSEKIQEGQLTPKQHEQTYRFLVKSASDKLRVDLACPTAAINVAELSGAAKTQGLMGHKTLTLTGLSPGPHYLQVEGRLEDCETASYRIRLSQRSSPPPLFTGFTFPPSSPDFHRVVQILTDEDGFGSGCLVGPSGLVLTSYHVLESDKGKPLSEGRFTISFVFDPAESAREQCFGRILHYDKELDLALIQITRDLAGQPLPPGNFPFLSLGNPSTVSLGQSLRLIGYPGQGWYRHRPGLVIKTGAVIGLERMGPFLHFKTDGSATGGFSGGAALDQEGRLVALVRGVVPPDTVLAATHIPAAWRSLLP